MNPLSFRLAVAADAEAVTALVNSAYRGDSSRRGWTTEADLLDGQRTDAEALREAMAQSDQVFLLAFAGSQLVGSVHLQKRGDTALLGMLTIDPDRQAAGLGKALIQQAEGFAHAQWQACQMEMTVINLRHELIAYYERRGYHRTGEDRPFPMTNPRFGLPKRNDFHLIVLRKDLSFT